MQLAQLIESLPLSASFLGLIALRAILFDWCRQPAPALKDLTEVASTAYCVVFTHVSPLGKRYINSADAAVK